MTREQWYWNVYRPQMLRNAYAIGKIGYGGIEETLPEPVAAGPLCFTGLEPEATVKLVGMLYDDESEEYVECDTWCHLQYSTDGCLTWTGYPSRHLISLDSCLDNKVYFRADPDNPNVDGFSTSSGYRYHQFILSNSIAASGNILYLLISDGSRQDVPDKCYYSLFNDCTSLTLAPELPAMYLSPSCYSNMFNRCTSLNLAPRLPANSLADNCYGFMFSSCESLTFIPELKAKSLAMYCYFGMFNDCTTLNINIDSSVPGQTIVLDTTDLDLSEEGCVESMFYNIASGTIIVESNHKYYCG